MSHSISYTPSLALTPEELSFLLTPFDLKRLESYAQNSLDYHVILDLLPTVALLYFEKRLGNEVRLSVIQSSILLGMGLQRKSVEGVEVRELPNLSFSSELVHSYAHFAGGASAARFPGARAIREAYSQDLRKVARDSKARDRLYFPSSSSSTGVPGSGHQGFSGCGRRSRAENYGGGA